MASKEIFITLVDKVAKSSDMDIITLQKKVENYVNVNKIPLSSGQLEELELIRPGVTALICGRTKEKGITSEDELDDARDDRDDRATFHKLVFHGTKSA